MKLLPLCAGMILSAAMAVQADEPKAQAPVASVTEAPPLKTAEQLAADDKAMRERADRDRERQAWAVKQMRSQGYKPNTRKDGTVLWCRNETPIGSHLEQQRCSTIEAVLDTQKKGQELTNQLYEQGNKNIKYYGP